MVWRHVWWRRSSPTSLLGQAHQISVLNLARTKHRANFSRTEHAVHHQVVGEHGRDQGVHAERSCGYGVPRHRDPPRVVGRRHHLCDGFQGEHVHITKE